MRRGGGGRTECGAPGPRGGRVDGEGKGGALATPGRLRGAFRVRARASLAAAAARRALRPPGRRSRGRPVLGRLLGRRRRHPNLSSPSRPALAAWLEEEEAAAAAAKQEDEPSRGAVSGRRVSALPPARTRRPASALAGPGGRSPLRLSPRGPCARRPAPGARSQIEVRAAGANNVPLCRAAETCLLCAFRTGVDAGGVGSRRSVRGCEWSREAERWERVRGKWAGGEGPMS
uniref:Uncharacterized protein n=1 Tax=Rangifer tarandus platyrhynchus TaxID=3082113 RepID=A0ACB0DRB3_RANTA|nr:unnamed protein product [Rangifer tarandus platyrhynchus]